MAMFIPKLLKPPVTTRPIQLNHIGTVQPPIMAGQPRKNRNTWNSATTPKITLAMSVKVFWLMAQCPRRYSPQFGIGARQCPLRVKAHFCKAIIAVTLHMSAYGPYLTSHFAPHTSAFRSKADIACAEVRFCGRY